MKKNILRYFKHILATIIVLSIIGFIILLSLNGSIGYSSNNEKTNLDHEGPYVFFEGTDSMKVNYIRGDKEKGFYLEQTTHSDQEHITATCFVALDSSSFEFTVQSNFTIPPSIYDDGHPIVAISDIESGYKTFRDFLIKNNVINEQLEWTFGQGHLVLVGDFVDRGFSTNQVLWFIYKLEKAAGKLGGHVHFILGNHELYNMQGKYQSASYKYYGVASILGKQHHHLYDQQSFIGRWMASKNTIERINGHLFAHGGLHPDLTQYELTLDSINQINRANYYTPYYPKAEKTAEQIITSNGNGICWYRGYFKDDLSQETIEQGLAQFNAKAIIVGHSLQWKVNKYYNGKVLAIDVKHPKDYNKNFPSKSSEGLLIEQGQYHRLFANGEKKKL